MSGSATPQRQVQNTSGSSSSTSGPGPVTAPKLESIADDLWSYYGANAQAPGYYPGSAVAPLSSQSQSAINALFARGAAGSSALEPAAAELNKTVSGDYLSLDNNPYFQGALSAGFKPQTEQFVKQLLPAVAGQFSGAGRYGSDSQKGVTGMALDSLNRAQADASAKASSGAYDAERGRMMSALGLAPSYLAAGNAADYQDLNAMLQAGSLLDQQAQRTTDADVARYNYQQTAQPNWYATIAQMLQGIYPSGTTSGTSSGSSSGTLWPSKSDDTMGNILGVASIAAPLLFSDKRLKDDITPVGELHDGQTVYSYRYKGEPRTQIGLPAQEVERVHPEAVARHPSGYLMVDYRRAMPAGGLL